MAFLRKWVTPLTIGAFILMATTGLLMFFHKNIGVNRLAHEWMSWAFVTGAILHVVLNIRPFVVYFKRPFPLAVISLFVLILGLSFISWGGPKPPNATRAVMASLTRAPLSDLAPLAHATPDELAVRLRAKGYAVSDASQNLATIAGDPRKANAALGIVFASDPGAGGDQKSDQKAGRKKKS
ncbi:DUF4405 domain-containing protein [Asticcacaulis sp. EMRT-3]|uniref:DUF4405 domain-containing protein n=1 Tax=Asticcacaulis sp. EMRT-3 TaxID=3040349 RepID=UPI0024AFB6B1|nr:DUF4405 domain-containing protein [Asticcacaulis sp. EMRT-3]MDI7774141.1 DUF4405 domain-containing protein [Asticcacaulis sp. EMRT-3]